MYWGAGFLIKQRCSQTPDLITASTLSGKEQLRCAGVDGGEVRLVREQYSNYLPVGFQHRDWGIVIRRSDRVEAAGVEYGKEDVEMG